MKTRGVIYDAGTVYGTGLIRLRAGVPCGCFVHFADIQMNGYRKLRAGRRVQFTFGRLGALQDSCAYRAAVWPDG